MPVFADDDVIMHGDAEWRGDVDDRLGHLDIGLRRRRIAGGMVVHQSTMQAICSDCALFRTLAPEFAAAMRHRINFTNSWISKQLAENT